MQEQDHKSYINAIGTAVPGNAIPQQKIAEFMAEALNMDTADRRKLNVIYRQTRIDQRHSVLPDYGLRMGEYTFYPNTAGLEPFPSVSERNAVYRRETPKLALAAARNAFADYPDFDPQTITHVIVVSCTGFYAPGPDIELVEALGLPTTTHRLLINFMGCYGAFNGLKTADAIVRANPEAKVLVVSTELCTIHFQKKPDLDYLLSNALFADGAAAVLVEGKPRADKSLRMRTFFCDLLAEGRDEMAWHVSDFGFEMTLTAEVPGVIERNIGRLLSRLLEKSGLTIGDIHYYALHPGGRRILEAIEKQLGLDIHDNRYAYHVLKQYGNMSSATVLFVLREIWQELGIKKEAASLASDATSSENILSCAFGPGLTLESLILEAHVNEPVVTSSVRSSETVPTL